MEMSSKLSRNSFETWTKREVAAIVLVNLIFKIGEFPYSRTNSPLSVAN